MSRFGLNDVDLIDLSAEDLENIGVASFEKSMDGTVTLSDADPRRKLIQAFAYVGYMMLNNADFAAKQTLLPFAVDDFLDLIGSGKNVPRLQESSAKTVVRFNCNAFQSFTIPTGTRMNAGTVNFISTEDVFVPQGATSIEVPFECEEKGEIGNGFLPGQINQIESPDDLPWVSSGENITKSAGGADIEEDDPYAERIRLSNERYAVSGPSDAYKYFAMSANQRIIDALARSTSDAVVQVYLLMENGEMPTEEDISIVLVALSDKNIRPLTDKVEVLAPDVHSFDLTVTYYVDDAALQTSTDAAVNEAVNEFVIWQKSKLGRGIDPSELYRLIQEKTSSARRIVVTPNEFMEIEENAVAVAENVTVACGGVVND